MGGKGSGGNRKLAPEIRAAVVDDLKAGNSIIATAANHGISHTTAQVIRNEHADELPNWKRRTAATFMRAAEKLANRIEREADSADANLQQQSISAGVLVDKIAALSDQPSQIIEHRHTISAENLASWMKQAQGEAAATVDIESRVSDCKSDMSDVESAESTAKTAAAGPHASNCATSATKKGGGGAC